MDMLIQYAYIVSAVLFIYGLKELSSPATARRGNAISSLGMLIAIAAALLDRGIVDYQWIVIGIALGSVIGAVAANKAASTPRSRSGIGSMSITLPAERAAARMPPPVSDR